jgi:hypothetical protein
MTQVNELTLVTTIRPEEPLGSPALEPARAQLLARATAPRGRRRETPARSARVRGLRWTVTPVSVAAAAALILGITGFGSSAPHGGSTVSGSSVTASAAGGDHTQVTYQTAAYTLNAAAAALAKSNTAIPRGDQFWYVKSTNGSVVGPDICWYSIDGSQVSRCTGSSIFKEPAAFDPNTPQTVAGWSSYLKQKWGWDSAGKASVAELESQYLVPASKATLFTYLASQPGITLVKGLQVSGRPVIGVDLTGDGQNVLLFSTKGAPTLVGIRKGNNPDLLWTTGIVNKAGQRP